MHARTPRVVISVEVFSTRIKKERDHNEFRAVGSSADPTTSSFRIVFMCDGREGVPMKITFDPRDNRSSSQALIWSWVHSQVLFVRLGMRVIWSKIRMMLLIKILDPGHKLL